MNQMMFNSEVELAKFLGSTDVIQDAYRAILETSSTNYQIHTTRSGFKILAFDSFPDYTVRFGNGEFDLVSSKDHKVNFISTDVNLEFSINEAAVELFDQLFVKLPEILNQVTNSPLIVTGRGLGGYLAILYALWHQRTIDVEVSNGSKTTKRPICITFGSPLLGDEPMRRAIFERPQWKSCFLNVVAKTDVLASFFSSNTLYKPFGNFLFCTESGGHTTFEDEEAIMVVLDSMALVNTKNISQMHDYKSDLGLIRKKVMYRGASKLGEFNLNSLKAGIVSQLMEMSLLEDIPNDLITKMEGKQVKIIKKKRIHNAYEPTKKLNDMKMSLTFMEWNMKIQKQKGGYYDSHKHPESIKDITSHHEVIKHQRILKQYWDKFVEEKDQMPQKDGAKLRKRWLYGGTNYRRIVEPLYIADHYKKGKKDYMEVRSNHFKLLEKWSEDDKKGQNKSDKKTKAASLTEDSCFWAHVEEALIQLGKLKNGEPVNFAAQFEVYVWDAIKDFSLSPDVFLEGSSLRTWWSEYKAYKESSYDSELARYMNNESYRWYK